MATKRTCPNGHQYTKSTDCPTCPICESERRAAAGLLSKLSAPARRAFERAGIRDAAALSRHTEQEILALHGVGSSTLPVLRAQLRAAKLSFAPAKPRAPAATAPKKAAHPTRKASPKSTAKLHEHFHKDGTLWARGELKAGVMEGPWEWFRKDGSLMRSGSFARGDQVGDWTTYRSDGSVVKVTKMKPKVR